MVTVQIKQLNSTVKITDGEQQKVHGGGAEELLRGYADGTYRLEPLKSVGFKFINSRGNLVGAVINGGGYNFFIHNGIIERVNGGSVDSVLNVSSLFPS